MSAERGEKCGETSVEREMSLGSVERDGVWGSWGFWGFWGERERVWDSGTLGSGKIGARK